MTITASSPIETIDSHVKNLRRKLELLDNEKTFIRSIYGLGYRWDEV